MIAIPSRTTRPEAVVPHAAAPPHAPSFRRSASAWELALLVVLALGLAGTFGLLIEEIGPLVAIAVPIFITVLLLGSRPDIGLLILAATIPLEAATMIPGGVSAARAIGVLVAFAWIMRKLLRREPLDRLVAHPLIIAGLLLVAYAAVSTLWGAYAIKPGKLFLLVQLFGFTIIASDLGGSWRQLDRFAKALLIGGLVCALLVIGEYIFGDVRRAGEGVTGGINASARSLVTTLPFAFYLISGRGSRTWRLAGGSYLLLALVGILLTFSRASFLLLLLIIPLYYGRSIRRGARPIWFAVPILALAIGIRFLPLEELQARIATIGPYMRETFMRQSGEVSSSRGFHLRVAVKVFLDHPVVGAGYGNYGAYFLDYQWSMPGAKKIWQSRRSSHSSHMGLLADLGLAGITLWFAVWFLTFRYLRVMLRGRPRSPPSVERLCIEAFSAALMLEFLYGFTAEIHVDKLLWLLFGLIVAAHRLDRTERAAVMKPANPQPSIARKRAPVSAATAS